MTISLPDCLDIQPEDVISGHSVVPGIGLTDITDDYFVIKAEELSSDDTRKIVFLYLCTQASDLSDFKKKVSEFGAGKIRKCYIVLFNQSQFLLPGLLFRNYAIRKMSISGSKIAAPLLYSKGGENILNMTLLPQGYTEYLEWPVIERIKSSLKFYKKLVSAFINLEFSIFDMSECLD